MDKLVAKNGAIDFGLISEPVDRINYLDFNLRSPLGRKRPLWLRKLLFKQFFFVGLNSPQISAGVAVVDLQYVANAFCYVYDRQKKDFFEINLTTLPFRAHIPPCPEEARAEFQTSGMHIKTSREAVWVKAADCEWHLQWSWAGLSPLRLCTRTGYSGWTYTQKTAPLPLSGYVRRSDRNYDLSPETCLGVTDWTAGYLRRNTFWNWAASAGRLSDGRSFALNCSCGVNETEATENVVWIEGVQMKIPHVKFYYNAVDLSDQWRIISSDGRIDLEFIPVTSRAENVNAILVATRFTQLIGHFSGVVVDDNGERVDIINCPGWTEDHFARW
jgi:hypothetical protein